MVHMSGLVSCGKCARYIRASESACPFCRARQGSGLAPRLGFAFAFAFVSATTIACESKDDGDSVSASDTANMSQGSVGNDTITDDATWGEGSTYAGPDEFDTTGQYDPSTSTSSGSSSDGTTMDQTDWGEGSTYAGPDEFDTTGPTGSSSGDGDGGAAESGSTAG